MSQERFHDYFRPLSSFDENSRILGIASKGVICGFDRITTVMNSSTITLRHDLTGIKKTSSDNLSISNPQGCVVSSHGVVIYEDAPISLNVQSNSGVNNTRIDYLVMEHQWVESEGGSPASYSIIRGPSNGDEPNIVDPKRQVLIGKLYLQPNKTYPDTARYERTNPKTLGGQEVFSYLTDGISLPTINFKSWENNLNNLIKSGIHYIGDNAQVSNRPGGGNDYKGFLMVFRRGVELTQFYVSAQSGRVYVRGAEINSPTNKTFKSWTSLNNNEISGSITDLGNIIGDREYPSNLLTRKITITATINEIAAELEGIYNDLDYINNTKANKSITITAGGGLDGGGDLSQNRVINIAPSGIKTAMVGNLQITASKLAVNSVTTDKVLDGAITHPKLFTNAVKADNIAANAVKESKINDGAVTTNKIGSTAVTHSKLSPTAVREDRVLIPSWRTTGISSNWSTGGYIDAEGFGYRRNINGVVEMKGLVWRDTGLTVDFFLTLPTGYRPAKNRYFIISDWGDNPITLKVDASNGRCTIFPIRSGAMSTPSNSNSAFIEVSMPL